MKIAITMFLSTLLFACNLSATPANYKDVNATEAKVLVEQNKEIVVLDIRTPKEYNAGHIDGALNINYSADNFKEELAKLDKSATYIVHCKSGGRSGRSMSTLEALGFENIVHMDDGFDGWLAATEK
jgi:rhodanese-related sulfurtransferase